MSLQTCYPALSMTFVISTTLACFFFGTVIYNYEASNIGLARAGLWFFVALGPFQWIARSVITNGQKDEDGMVYVGDLFPLGRPDFLRKLAWAGQGFLIVGGCLIVWWVIEI